MCSPGESETSFTGKLMASLTICHNKSSGTSGVANGFTTRKQTSVNGSARNSSSSSGECRAISAGIYNPPSGASPRNTAPRSEVRGALPVVLRYLNANRRVHPPQTPCATSPETHQRYAAIRAVQPLPTSCAPVPHNSAAAHALSADNSAQPSRAKPPLASLETRHATTPAWDRLGSVQSAIVVRALMPPDAQQIGRASCRESGLQ